MNQIKIIGITGRKFSGKDTVGNYFVEKYGFERVAYADPLKQATQAIFDFDDEQLYGNQKEILDTYWNVTPRQTLQFIGTDLFRNHISELLPNMGKDIWIHALKRKILKIQKKNPDAKIVITDVRFPNELQAIKDLGGITIKIQRDNAQQKVTKEYLLNEIKIIGGKLQNSNDYQEIDTLTKQLHILSVKLQETDTVKDMHESEILIDNLKTDYVFDNNNTKEQLYAMIVKELEMFTN